MMKVKKSFLLMEPADIAGAEFFLAFYRAVYSRPINRAISNQDLPRRETQLKQKFAIRIHRGSEFLRMMDLDVLVVVGVEMIHDD